MSPTTILILSCVLFVVLLCLVFVLFYQIISRIKKEFESQKEKFLSELDERYVKKSGSEDKE